MIREITFNDERKLFQFFIDNRSEVPFYYSNVSFEEWRQSFLEDTDFDGTLQFKDLKTYILFKEGKIEGFIQFGLSSFVFGDIQKDNSNHYGIIRNFYYLKTTSISDIDDLLELSTNYFNAHSISTSFAYFQYFGMTCFSRQGKLHDSEFFIEKSLMNYGYNVEQENVYYTKRIEIQELIDNKINLDVSDDKTKISFIHDNKIIGQTQLQYNERLKITYMRWIGIKEQFRSLGLGSKCLKVLLSHLYSQGFTTIETDTADSNLIAQRFYDRNKFINKGIMRSYIKHTIK